jgi:CRP-like cAMP-binding protein
VFAQGGPADGVFYLQKGSVKLSVLAATGKEAVVAMFVPGDFFGDAARIGNAIDVTLAGHGSVVPASRRCVAINCRQTSRT